MFLSGMRKFPWCAFVLLTTSLESRSQTQGLLREVWEGIGGAAVSDLTSHPDYPAGPTSTGHVTDLFEAPTDILENYGQRMHGYIVPPLTGDYTFWIASDDGGDLYLSTDENPANAARIARVDSWTAPREWGKEANQQSEPIRLTAGTAYYIAALMKEAFGGDNLAVRWRMPDGTDQAPIVGTNLLPWGISFSPPSIARQPSDTNAVEGGIAFFEVGLGTVGPAAFQWRRDGIVLPGATEAELRYSPARLSDNGARFSVMVTNRLGSVTSREAVLTVTPDVTPPVIAGVLNIGTTTLRVSFSEPVSAPSALTIANYRLTPERGVYAARFGADSSTIELTIDPLGFGEPYTLTVNGVLDAAQDPNAIEPNSGIDFVALEYAPATVGQPPLLGHVTPAASGADLLASGDIGGTADAFEFGYQPVTGNFDRRVRVAVFSPSDPFASAGLMARATLDTGSPFAAILTTPAQIGSYFLSRSNQGAEATRNGRHPPNYPDTWLRLARVGNSFRGYASFNGDAWTELGRATLNLPETLLLGLAAASRDPGETTVVQFRDAGPVSNPAVAPAPSTTGETLGPSSRHTSLVLSEIMYHPAQRADRRDLEFVEIYNADLIEQDLTGHRLSGSISFAFPDGFTLPAGGFAVIARLPAHVRDVHGLNHVLGPFEGTASLPNDAGSIALRNSQGAMLLEVNYADIPPWPAAADGAGHSLVLQRPSYGEDDPRAWGISARIGGSPGAMDGMVPVTAPVLINEILAHTDLPQLDFLELYNHSNEPVTVGGFIITDDPGINRFRIPDGTVITPRGFLAFDEAALGFGLDAAGETVFLIHSNLTRVTDAVRFEPQEGGLSSGRSPDGTPEWRRLERRTKGAENAAFKISEVLINEIMYAPISGEDSDEFVELHHRGVQPIDLGGWALIDGITYRFPPGTVMPPGAFFVIARDRAQFIARHRSLPESVVFGDFDGNLSNGGERIALAMPEFVVSTNDIGFVQTNRIDITLDEVTYGTGGRWGRWSDGLGSSLELIDPNSDHRQPSNWADSDDSDEAPWTVIEFTGRVDHVADSVSTSRLHLLAQGPGEYLIDDVQVLAADGASRLANGDSSAGINGWTAQGNHRNSRLDETQGFNGGRALRVIATGRGDTAVNRVRASISPPLTANASATLRARVRWVRGWPEFLVRTLGSGIEAHGRLDLPASLGSPGAANSRRVANGGPAIFDVTHRPVVAVGGEPVRVTARVTDPDGIDSVVLRFRVDPAATATPVPMRDDGTGGDEVAGDGTYSATISGRAEGTLVAFVIRAGDAAPAQAFNQFPSMDPQQEGLIRWGEQPEFGNLGVYRFWQRRSDYQLLRSRERLANDNLDCTFVYGDQRVIYNAEMRAKGSPWHGGSVGADYVFSMPPDDRLLGERDMAIVTVGNLGNDASAQREQAAFWIGRQLGIPTLHRRHVRFFENGTFKGLYEDTEEPNGQYVDAWFPGGEDGELFKVEDWFEFNDAGDSFVFSRDATLQPFTTTGGALKLARYRWSWRKRAVVKSANDYDSFFQLVQTVNGSGPSYPDQVANIMDVDTWMRVFALQHIVGNWDAYGHGRGKNAYVYLPTGGRWTMIPWDIDFVLGSGSDGPTADVFSANDPVVGDLWSTPAIARMYWRAFQDAVNGPLREGAIGPVLDGRYDALTANGFTVEGTDAIKAYVSQRRDYLASRLNDEDALGLTITSNAGASFSTNRNLVTLSGSAPIAAASLAVNDLLFPVTWTTLTTWRFSIPLAAATNVLHVIALDPHGQPIPGLADTITVRYTGPLPTPEGLVVINEIMFDPPPGGAEFVEVHNTSPTGAFDLSGWRLDGVDFTFPAGTLLPPNGYLVIADDVAALSRTYGPVNGVAGRFPGNLQTEGERLQLIRPGATPALDQVIDAVRYSGEPPWPQVTHDEGPSLQLLDPLQDNRRPANWGATNPNANPANIATPGRANSLRTTLEPFPDLWLNEVLPHNMGARADASGEFAPWIELYNSGDVPIDLSEFFLNSIGSSPTQWAFPPGSAIGPGQYLLVWCDAETNQTTQTELHAAFRLPSADGDVGLVRIQNGSPAVLDHLAYRALPAGKAWGSFPDGDPLERRLFHLPTPAFPNNPAAPPSLVFINEWMADNRGAVVDPADGDPEDWFELYNAADTPADLSAFTLSDDPADPERFQLANGTVIPPGGFLHFWADNEPLQNSPGQIHLNFRISDEGETLLLTAPDGTVIDTVMFGAQSNNLAQGRFPDGGSPPFVFMDYPTLAGPNAYGVSNLPPVMDGLAGRMVEEGAEVRFDARASDPDAGQQLRFSLLGAPPAARIDPLTGTFTWATTEADGPGEFTFSVQATDDGQPPRSATQPMSIVIREVNQPPALETPSDLTVGEGTRVQFSVGVTDPDLPTQALAFALAPGAPAGATLHPVTGLFSWTPAESHGPESYSIGIHVSDAGIPPLSASTQFRISVEEVDNAPVFDVVSLQSTDELSTFTLTLVARDPDTPASPIQYRLEIAPSGSSIDPASGRFTWVPSETDGPGTYPVKAIAAQEAGGPEGSLGFSIVVNELNQPPWLDLLPSIEAAEGQRITFTASATDDDLPAQRLFFTLDPGAPAGAAIDPNSGVFTWHIGDDAGAGTHSITIRVTDSAIEPASAVQSFTISVRPEMRIVINEIMYAPAMPDTEFVELFNASASTAWPIGGWRLTGLDFVLPEGTTLEPASYLVVARDTAAFRSAYGTSATVLGNATPAFSSAGLQVVRLQRPAPGDWETLDEVAFLRTAPWPAAANGGGASLQLMDARQDNRRVANWAGQLGTTTNAPRRVINLTDAWRFFQTGPAPASWREPAFNDAAWPSGPGLLYVEDAPLPGPKNTALIRTEGRMTYYFRTRFNFSGNPDGAALLISPIVDDGFALHLNGQEILRLGLDPGATILDSTPASRTIADAVAEGPITIPITSLLPGENVLAVEVHQVNATSSDIVWGATVDLLEVRRDPATPGYANSVRASLAPFPDVWIHEVLPLNTTGVMDNTGEREPWIELANAGTNAVDLTGWWLTDNLNQLTRWAFPTDAFLEPHALRLVWADAEPSETLPNAWHSSFRLSHPAGVVALVRQQNGAPAVVDFTAYEVAVANQSFGIFEPADPLVRGVLTLPSPGAANQANAPGGPLLTEVETLGDGNLRLRWSSVSGATYRVQEATAVTGPWIASAPPIIANGPEAAQVLPIIGGARFYRVARMVGMFTPMGSGTYY
jgi:hypothetical protein